MTINIVGGGFVGLSTALSLQRLNRAVRIIDRHIDAGSKAVCSYGNAGVMAGYEILGMNRLGIVKKVPGMVGGPVGFVGLRGLVKFAANFVASCSEEKARHTMTSMRPLCSAADAAWRRVFDEIHPHDPSAKNGITPFHNYAHPEKILHATDSAGVAGLRADQSLRERYSMASTLYTNPRDLKQLEPVVFASAKDFSAATVWEDTWSFSCPQTLLKAMRAAVIARGGEWVADHVKEVGDGGRTLIGKSGTLYEGEASVLAGGWETPELYPRNAGSLPITGERGYHIEFKADPGMLRHSLGWQPGKFFLTPMDGRIRAAGLSEWGADRSTPPSKERWEYLESLCRELIPSLPPRTPSGDWMGVRPTTPDYMPVIGGVPKHPNLFVASGHGHLGATLGAVSGEVVADLIAERTPVVDAKPFGVERFCF